MVIDRFEEDYLGLPLTHGFCEDKVSTRRAKLQKSLDAVHSVRDGEKPREPPLKLKSVEWQWLYGYGSGNVFSWKSGDTIIPVQGKNASGKSAFADVVAMGLFGRESQARESKHRTNSIICDSKPDNASAWVEVTVDVEGSVFRIRREYCARGDKLNQQAMVTGVSGAVVHTGKSGVDAWVSQYITYEEFLLSDRRDRDMLSLAHGEQKAIIDAALRTTSIQTGLDAVDEARKAHKWLGDGLHAAAESLARTEDDPDDDALANAMSAVREERKRGVVLAVQHAFARLAHKALSARCDIAARLAELGPVEAERIDEDKFIELSNDVRTASERARGAATVLRGIEAAAVQRPPDKPQESIEYLEEKTEKYCKALRLATTLEEAGPECAFNGACWACMEREGGKVKSRQDSLDGLTGLGIKPDISDIKKKYRGYEQRLEAARKRAESEEAYKAWSERRDAAAEDATSAKEGLEKAQRALKTARLQQDLFEFGESGHTIKPDSGLLERLASKVYEARRRESDARVMASERMTLRRSANRQRQRAKTLASLAQECYDKAAEFKEAHAEASARFEEAYREAISTLVDTANAVLQMAYPFISIEAEVSKSFVFWMRNSRGTSVPVEKASGFERAAMSLAIKAALVKLGYVRSVGLMILDEAVAGFDDENIERFPDMLNKIAATTGSIVVPLTHRAFHGLPGVCIEETSDGSKLVHV